MSDRVFVTSHARNVFYEGKYSLDLSLSIRFIDFSLVIFCFFVGAALYNKITKNIWGDVFSYSLIGVFAAVLFVAANEMRGLYQRESLLVMPRQMRGVVVNWVMVWSFLAFGAFAMKASADFSRAIMLSVALLGVVSLLVSRVLLKGIAEKEVQTGRLMQDKAAVVFLGDKETTYPHDLQNMNVVYSQRIEERQDAGELQREVRAFAAAAHASHAQKIVIVSSFENLSFMRKMSDFLRISPLPGYVVTEDWVTRAFSQPVHFTGNVTGFSIQSAPLNMVERALKRGFDMVIAGFGLLFVLPLLLFVALAIKIDSPGPIFFRQKRLGFNGKSFNIFKFRSMRVMEDGTNVRQAKKNDSRVTKVGRFIRATSIDELPQLINVLRGEMSLIGPRPHAIAHDDHYDTVIADYSMRRHMKPGLTGWAQVNGLRGETPNVESMAARVSHDLWYINNWSVWLDLWILARTVHELIRNKDVY